MKYADYRRFAPLAILLAFAFQSVSSGAVALSELLEPGGSFVVGDSLVFDQFTFSGTGDIPDASSVRVEGTVDGEGNFGIRFIGGLSFGPVDTDISLGYRVSTTSGGNIVASTFSGNPALITSSNEANLTVTSSLGGETLTLFDNTGGTLLLDSGSLPAPASALDVGLSIDSFIPAEPGGRSTISFLDQMFDEGDNNVVPEPASVVIWLGTMLVVGIIPVTCRRRQKGKSSDK